jgi:PAS domain S-box-containing protein
MAETILVVEDEAFTGLNLCTFLDNSGYMAEHCADGRRCLTRIETGFRPDLILMDIHLGRGKMDGCETARLIQKEYDIPVVLHSAYSDHETIERTKNFRRYGYIQKLPGNEQVILATIEMALTLHRTEKSLETQLDSYRTLYDAGLREMARRERAEKDLRNSEILHRMILSSISDTVFLTDEEDLFHYVCPNVEVIFGYDEAEVSAFGSIRKLFGESLVTKEELDELGERMNMERTVEDKFGVAHTILVNIKRVAIREATRLYTCREVSELKRKENALVERERQYRELSNHLLKVTEEHDVKIAQEIHDDLGQSLAALKMNLSLLNREDAEASPAGDGVSGTSEPLIAFMKKIVADMSSKIHAMTVELRPPVLDTLGILEAIEWQVSEFRELFGIDVSFHSDTDEIELGEEKSLAVYRIVQEALTNAARHANPDTIAVRAVCVEGNLWITVLDDGVGFDSTDTTLGSRFGLFGMRERAQRYDGRLRVESSPGKGTKVVATIPLGEAE